MNIPDGFTQAEWEMVREGVEKRKAEGRWGRLGKYKWQEILGHGNRYYYDMGWFRGDSVIREAVYRRFQKK